MRSVRRFLLLFAMGAISACGTVPIDHARQAYERGEYEQASSILSGDKIRKKDRLLALMEQGSIWHEAGDYKRSKDALLAASQLLKSTDYVSLSEKAASLTINEWTKTYRGESTERLWIHTYQMMNFLLLGESESAAVEARQAIALMASNGDELEKDFFTRAMLGTAFDSVRQYNDAYIEYNKLSELLPANAVAAELRDDRARKIGIAVNSTTSLEESTRSWIPRKKTDGELVIFVATGNIPKKISGNIFIYPGERISFPVYDIRRFSTPELHITLKNTDEIISSNDANMITSDLGDLARKALAARGTRIAASHIARSSIKHALVNATEDESASAAAILDVIFFLLEQADTRGWTTLPGYLSLLRIPLPSGTHSVTIRNTHSEGPVNTHSLNNIVITPGKTVYRKVRL